MAQHDISQAMGVLKSLNPGDYHVTVIAPDTFNHFTPLLPSAAVGTVSLRSLVESVRKVSQVCFLIQGAKFADASDRL